MTRRHPHHALISNPQDTVPPRGQAAQQSAWHSGTHARRPARDTPSSNPHGTAAPTRHAQQQSPWHSAARATRATRPTPIVTACHCVPRHSAAHATRPTQPAAAFQETSAASSHPQIHGFPAPATISQRPTPARTRDLSHRATKPAILATAHDSLRLPRGSTVQRLPERVNASEVPHLPRETQVAARKIMRARDTPRAQSPRHGA